MSLKFPIGSHPGREFVKVKCDVCGGLFYQKDTIPINDKYNLQHGLLVCKKDADQINEQVLPNNHFERPISQPELLRPERGDQFSVNELDDRLPGAPRLPFTAPNPINDNIDLFWQGPEDTGSSGIIGYKIERASPQLSYYDTIEVNTNEGATYYTDLTADVTQEYSYRVSAINSFGTGSPSIDFFWPTNQVPFSDVQYLIISPNNETLLIGPYYLRMNHQGEGIV